MRFWLSIINGSEMARSSAFEADRIPQVGEQVVTDFGTHSVCEINKVFTFCKGGKSEVIVEACWKRDLSDSYRHLLMEYEKISHFANM